MTFAQRHSLRARLLWLLLAAISLTAVVQAAVAYRTALAETDQIFDYQMQQMAMSLRPGLPLGHVPTAAGDPDAEDNFDFVIQISTADGASLFQSTARAELPSRSALGFSTVQARGNTYRVFSVASGSQVVQVAQDLEARRVMASTLALRTVGPTAVMVPALMMVVWWVINASLAPVARVRSQVAARQADDLSEVSETGLPDEIRPLVHELNLLLARMHRAFDAQRSFVADAAHELRSPLAALKLQVQGLRRATSDEAREVAVTRLTAGIDRSTRLVEQLLVLARQQSSGETGAVKEQVHLSHAAQMELADAVGSALVRKIDLGLEHADEGVVIGHEDALRILIRNLLDNAIKYTPLGGKIDLGVCRTNAGLALTVKDNGPGIPTEDRLRVLDRFYRVPGTEATGSGLGLAIVSAIADMHGAHLTLDTAPDLGGLRVTVLFPAAA